MKASLLKESDEHDALRVAIQLVCDDLKLASVQEMSSLIVREGEPVPSGVEAESVPLGSGEAESTPSGSDEVGLSP